LAGKDWPNAVTFRRWMRRRTFRNAVKGIRDALRFQADLHLTAAAAVAAQAVSESVTSPQTDEPQLDRQRDQLKDLVTLLKLVHTRERFTMPREPAESAPPPRPRARIETVVLEYLRQRQAFKPHTPLGEVMRSLAGYDPTGERDDVAAERPERRTAA
jgi:hypothetical protein